MSHGESRCMSRMEVHSSSVDRRKKRVRPAGGMDGGMSWSGVGAAFGLRFAETSGGGMYGP